MTMINMVKMRKPRCFQTLASPDNFPPHQGLACLRSPGNDDYHSFHYDDYHCHQHQIVNIIVSNTNSTNIIILSTVDVKCGASSPESESESLPPNISEVNEFFEFALWKLLGITFLNEFCQKIINATINSITMFSPLSSLSLSASSSSPMIVNHLL